MSFSFLLLILLIYKLLKITFTYWFCSWFCPHFPPLWFAFTKFSFHSHTCLLRHIFPFSLHSLSLFVYCSAFFLFLCLFVFKWLIILFPFTLIARISCLIIFFPFPFTLFLSVCVCALFSLLPFVIFHFFLDFDVSPFSLFFYFYSGFFVLLRLFYPSFPVQWKENTKCYFNFFICLFVKCYFPAFSDF